VTNIICILCPKGCHLTVDENNNFAVAGHQCKRGETYGKNELKNPTRVISSTVKIKGAIHRRCPVKTALPIPKSLINEAVKLLNNVELTAPVIAGQVVAEDICGTGIAFVTTRSM
jgi:CxxC motif-containing protein